MIYHAAALGGISDRKEGPHDSSCISNARAVAWVNSFCRAEELGDDALEVHSAKAGYSMGVCGRNEMGNAFCEYDRPSTSKP
jgi:hypothetical protein